MTLDRGAIALVLIGGVGLVISVYLTIAHYSGAPLACVSAGPIDCGAVTTSSFSLVPGTDVPITITGLLWFGVTGLVGLASVRGAEPRWLRSAHFAWCVSALLVVLYLVRAEIVVISRICEWCTVVHVLVLLSFLIALRRLQDADDPLSAAG